jgi:hypothetical protein
VEFAFGYCGFEAIEEAVHSKDDQFLKFTDFVADRGHVDQQCDGN